MGVMVGAAFSSETRGESANCYEVRDDRLKEHVDVLRGLYEAVIAKVMKQTNSRRDERSLSYAAPIILHGYTTLINTIHAAACTLHHLLVQLPTAEPFRPIYIRSDRESLLNNRRM